LNKLEKHLSGQLMLLSRPLISPSPDFRRQIKALVPPGTANTFSTPPREIMRTRTHACTHAGTRSARLHATAIIAARQYARRGERRTEWRKNGTLLVFANDVPTCARRLPRLGRFIETAAVPLAKMAARISRPREGLSASALSNDENSVNSPSRRYRATALTDACYVWQGKVQFRVAKRPIRGKTLRGKHERASCQLRVSSGRLVSLIPRHGATPSDPKNDASRLSETRGALCDLTRPREREGSRSP